jgi:hypothetical protein
MSHGSEFGWLQALIPGIIVVDDGSSDDLYFTPEGLDALPALSESDINAGPWHSYFTGDLGGLDVLVRSSDISTCGGEVLAMAVQECEDAPVIIGGSQVSITDDIDDDEPTATATSCIPAIPGYRCDGKPSSGSGTVQTPTAPSSEATTAPEPPAATATPSGGTAGAGGGPVGITAPDTGDGSTAAEDTTPLAAMVLLAASGATLLGASALGFRRKR